MSFNYRSFFSNNISHKLAQAAPHARWFAFICTILIIGITQNNLMSTHWSTGVTAAGTLFSIYGVWLTLEIFRIGENFSQQQAKLIEEVHRSVMTGLKVQHGHELRRKYEAAKDRGDDSARIYWNFIWRFETMDHLGLSLEPDGYARIRIIGVSNRAMETELERLEIPIYTVKILEVKSNDQLTVGLGYCSCINGRCYISNTANELDLHSPTIEFSISGIGPIQASSMGDKPKNFKRLKDLKDPSSGDNEQE